MPKRVIIFCAHSDDEAAGAGGTLVKLIKEKYNIIKVVFSSGELSHPHYKRDVIVKERIKETLQIGKKYKIRETVFFNLEDSKLKKNMGDKIKEEIVNLIEKHNPHKIFIPSEHDPHSDHRAVHDAVLEVLKNIKYQKELYSYEVWNIVRENYPAMYVDISKYFKKKIEMMKGFKNQWHFMYPLILPIYFRARYYGYKAGCKYAEKFYKIR